MADFTDLELLQSQDRLWEMGTPGGAFVGGKPKKRSDYGKRTRTLADYRAGDTAQRETPTATPQAPGGNVIKTWIPSPAEQYAISNSNLGAATQSIQRENDSRVSQRREMRRMAHEQQLAAMRMQSENARANADREAMLIRELLSGM